MSVRIKSVKKKQFGVRLGGKLHRETFATKAAAREWQVTMRQQYEREMAGDVKALQHRTVADVASLFLEKRQHQKMYRHDLYRIKTYIIPEFETRLIHQIRREEWEVLLGDGRSRRPGTLVTKHGLSNRTSNLVKSLVSTMYEYARIYLRCTETNPIRDIKVLPTPKRHTQVLRPGDEMAKYLKAMSEDKFYPKQAFVFAMLALNCGQRVGQILGLKWEDCDFDSGLIYWRYKWDYRTKGFILGSKKGDNDHHSTGMNKALRAALLKWRGQTEYRAGSDYILTTADRFPLTLKQVFDCNKRALKKAELTYQKVHSLRHSYATAYVESGGSIYDLQEILNHSSVTVTERYRQLNRERQQKAASVLQVGSVSTADADDNEVGHEETRAG